jgi:hypothetical protein
MQEGQLLMTQGDRDRLVALKKAKRKLITQRQAAEELGVSVRQVRRLVQALKGRGDKAVVHGLRGRASNRRIDEAIEKEAVRILAGEDYRQFGPKLASEHLRELYGINASKETVRQWMMRAKLWRGRRRQPGQVHLWRPRRSRLGELIQWDTSEHDWLEGRGEKMYLITMLDDATSRLLARFVRHDSTEENMKLLWSWLEKYGRPLAVYTDKASLFQTAEKRRRDEPGVDQDRVEMPPTQIGRALQELGIAWIGAHSPQAKGRVERSFATAQDRLVKGMRVAGVSTIEQANQYLQEKYLPWWERELTVKPANSDDAHRRLEESHNLAASLSHVEKRQVRNNYTIPVGGQFYRILRESVVPGLRLATVRVEQRLDGTIAVCFRGRYLAVERCEKPAPSAKAETTPAPKAARKPRRRGSDWGKNFDLKKAPPVWKAARSSGHRSGGSEENGSG